MSLVDLLRSPWAILPDRLDEIQAVYGAHVRGEAASIETIEARLGRKLENQKPAYEMRSGGIAVLSINGAIAPKANLFTQISGGASAQELVSQIEAMGDSQAVRGAVIAWDSPGGSVQGIPTLEKAIRALAEKKPTVSVCDGTMASAAYWCGSAANAIYASGETDTIGSIGVVATHTYDPRSEQRKVTEIVAGRYKRMASPNKPLTAEGEAYLQAHVDEIYSIFLEAVASNRRVSVEDVLAFMADGRVFVGRQALAAGLIDGFGTVEQLAEQMAADPEAFASRRKARIPAAETSSPRAATGASPAPVAQVEKDHPMDPKELAASWQAEHPEAVALLTAAATAQGAQAERDRIAAVREQLMPGHEALIERLAMDGKTTGPEAAMAVLAAERSQRQAQAAARSADAPRPVPMEPAPFADAPSLKLGTPGRLDAGVDMAALDAAAKAYAAAHPGTTYVAALRAVQSQA